MTVCVATMANNGVLVFAADRMLTRGVTQTEPNNAKIYHFDGPPPVTVMWAGASTVFGEVIQACIETTRKKPDRCKTISDYVSLYCDSFAEYLGMRAERTVLTRLGLTRKSLISSTISNDRADKLIRLVMEYLPLGGEDVEVIIAGHDDGGAHIWAIHNDISQCHDVEGYASIGIGADHADSQLRFAGYTRNAEPREALVLAYLAKRRAEMAPGVGKATDVHIRGTDGRAVPILDAWMLELNEEHRKFAEAEQGALTGAIASATATIAALATAPTLPPTAPGTPVVQDPAASTPGSPPLPPPPE